jgi:hypothetical protein
MSPPHLSNELVDLAGKSVIEAVYRGFYVIVPTHYVLRGLCHHCIT